MLVNNLHSEPCREKMKDIIVEWYPWAFTCSKLTTETLEQSEICSELTIKTPERRQ